MPPARRRLAPPPRAWRWVLVAWIGALVVNRSLVRVTGRSMAPTLAPGDIVLTVPARFRRPRAGDVVVVADPRQPERHTIKRAVAWTEGGLVVHGDDPAASTDSRVFGPVPEPLVHATVPLLVGLPPRRLTVRAADTPRPSA